MERPLSNVNYENVCRLCLSTRGETQPIFSSGSSSDSPGSPVLASKIQECVSVKINESDGLPTQICKKCVNNVNNWHVFKKVCNENQAKLRDWVKGDAAHAQSINIKEEPEPEPLVDDINDEDIVIDASYPGVELVERAAESRLQPEGPPILASLGLAPRNEKEVEDGHDEDYANDEDFAEDENQKTGSSDADEDKQRSDSDHTEYEKLKSALTGKSSSQPPVVLRSLPVAQLGSKNCLICGRSYRYSHNARRHELTSHNYDRYTNKVKSPSPTLTKMMPNPLNPKSRLLPNPINLKNKMLPKSSHKNSEAPSAKDKVYPVRIRSLADLQNNGREPEILKSLLTGKPEILVSEPEILRSRSVSPETLISEPELSAFHVETIISEPDTYINHSDESDEEDNIEENRFDGSVADDGESEEEVEISSNVDINKIIGIESQEHRQGRENHVDSTEEITPDVNETDEEEDHNTNHFEEEESENSGDDGAENEMEYNGDNTGADEQEVGDETAHDEENEITNEYNQTGNEYDESANENNVDTTHGESQNESSQHYQRDSDESGPDYPDDGEDDDMLPVPIAPIVEINEQPDPEILEHTENENENGNDTLNESIDIKEISLPSMTITPAQKAFILKYRDVIEQVNTLKCKCCDKAHPKRKAVIQHLQKNGLKVPKHTCYNCVITFGHIGALLSHMRANICTDLWKIIYEEGGIPDSMVSESNATQEYRIGDASGREDTINKSQYKDILNSRTYACKLCPAKFQLKQFIMKHILDVHENGGQRIPLLCIHCKYRFKDNRLWKKHIRNGECTVHIACELCNEKFRSLLHFNDHALAVHAGGFVENSSDNLSRSVDGRRTDCPICHKNTASYHNLVKHLKAIHNEEKPHMCQHCDSKFETVTEFNHHIYKEHSERVTNGDTSQNAEQDTEDQVDLSIVKQEVTTYNYSCTDCSSMFDSVDGWTQHQIDAHNHTAYECDQCDKKFLQDSELIDHKNAHLRVKFYSCTVCSNSYGTPQRLSDHMLKSHPGDIGADGSSDTPFFCEMCMRSFKSRQAFSNHMRIHANVPSHNKKPGVVEKVVLKKPPPQAVPYNITFRNSPKMMNDAPYSCDICGKGFLHKKNIWKHKKVLHPDIVRRIELEKSGSHFMNIEEDEYINDDPNAMTGLSIPQFDSFTTAAFEDIPLEENFNTTPEPPQVYQCDLCDKKFAVKSSIWKHKRVKHGIVNPNMQEENMKNESRTSCTICKVNFPDKKAYYRHRKTVHKVNVQSCKICGKALNSTLELYEHYKASHAKELLGYNASQGNPNKAQSESHSRSHRESSEEGEEYQESENPEDQYQARYPCATCGKTFLGMMALQNHNCLQQNSSGSEKFDCEICHKSYTSISALKSHRGWHLRSPDGKAAFSSSGLWMPQNRQTNKVSKFEVRDGLTVKHSTPISDPEHLQIKRKLPPDVQMTLLKKKKLSDEVTVELVQTVPRIDPAAMQKQAVNETRVCHPCGKEFSKKAAFLRHVEEVHRPNSAFCPICNKSFTRKSTLLMHMQKHGIMAGNAVSVRAEMEEEAPVAVPPERYYNCDLCNVRYTSAKSLRRHCVKHHNIAAEDVIEERPNPSSIVGTRVIEVGGSKHKCGQCGEVFASDKDMWQHRHYSCDQCGMFFSRQQYLTAHVRARHPQESDKTFFPCNMCDRFYMNKKSLQRHIETSH